jgi:hypothetical protein
MSEKIKGCTVVFDYNFNQEYFEEKIKNALLMIKGVQEIKPITTKPDDFIIEARIKNEIRSKVMELLKCS